MKPFTSFIIPKEESCDLWRVKINKTREVEKPFLDQLFKFKTGIGLILFSTETAINDLRYLEKQPVRGISS